MRLANCNANGDAHIHSDGDGDSNGNAYAITDSYGDGHIHSDGDSNGNAYAKPDGNSNCDSNGAFANTDSNSHGDGAFADTDSDSNGDCDRTAAAYTDATSAGNTAASTLRPASNGCFFGDSRSLASPRNAYCS